MPELPEVQSVRRSLEPHVLGAAVTSVLVHRADVITGQQTDATLFVGQRITDTQRRGKQLALLADSGRVLLVQLGMSGQFFVHPSPTPPALTHAHVVWTLSTPGGNAPRATLTFRDPRRFGGITTLPTASALRTHWQSLGPDALDIDTAQLAQTLQRTKRAIKAALLDQAVLAGVGNIYADEALFAARIHPLRPAHRLSPAEIDRLAAAIRRILSRAVAAGGSTVRDYVNADRSPGAYATEHAVYGRAGQPCTTCGKPLKNLVVSQRTTVVCSECQPRRPAASKKPAFHGLIHK